MSKRPIRVLQLKPGMPSVSNPEDQEARLRKHFGDDVEVLGGGTTCPDEFWTLLNLLNAHKADVLDAELPSRLAQLSPRLGVVWIRPSFYTGARGANSHNSAYRGEFVGYEQLQAAYYVSMGRRRVKVERRQFPKEDPPPQPSSAILGTLTGDVD